MQIDKSHLKKDLLFVIVAIILFILAVVILTLLVKPRIDRQIEQIKQTESIWIQRGPNSLDGGENGNKN